MKLKILGAALLALVATSAFAVMNASANKDIGHFVHDGKTKNAIITGHEGKKTEHALKFYRLNPGTHTTADSPPIECEKSTYVGTVSEFTVKSITMTPTYTNCATEGGVTDSVKVTVNGCGYTFYSHGGNTHGTAEIHCPAGKTIEVHHPNCTINMPAQTTAATMTEGITYDNVTENGKHALTATVTVNTITGFFEGGICVFLGTNQKFEMKGSVTITGYEDAEGVEGAQLSITHT